MSEVSFSPTFLIVDPVTAKVRGTYDSISSARMIITRHRKLSGGCKLGKIVKVSYGEEVE